MIIQGRQSIDGQLFFEEIWYMKKSNMLQCVQMSRRKEHINELCGDWERGSSDQGLSKSESVSSCIPVQFCFLLSTHFLEKSPTLYVEQD